jgi:hypothetical protein
VEGADKRNVGAKTPSVKVVDAVNAPDVPVIVTVLWPVAAVLLATKVKVEKLVVVLGVKKAETPLGRPETARLTFPAKPYRSVTETLAFALWPSPTLTCEDAVSEKAGAWIVSVNVVFAVTLPETPVTVSTLAPAAAVLLTVNVRVLLLVAEAGENAAVTPAGRPLIERLTAPAKL